MAKLQGCPLLIQTASCKLRTEVPFLLPGFWQLFRVFVAALHLSSCDKFVIVLSERFSQVTKKEKKMEKNRIFSFSFKNYLFKIFVLVL